MPKLNPSEPSRKMVQITGISGISVPTGNFGPGPIRTLRFGWVLGRIFWSESRASRGWNRVAEHLNGSSGAGLRLKVVEP